MVKTTSTSPKYVQRRYKRVMKVYSEPEHDAFRETKKNLSQVPVFRLPKSRRLSSIPEEAQVQWGFNLRMSLRQRKNNSEEREGNSEGREDDGIQQRQQEEQENPPTTRRFMGLLSLSCPNKRLIEQSATTNVEFRSFARSAMPIVLVA